MLHTLSKKLRLITTIGILTVSATSIAQEYPTHPVKVIVPFPAGAGVDIVTRLVTTKLGEAMGQPFVIENKSGAGGTVGAGEAARAKNDGYTLLAGPSSVAISKILYKNLPFDIEKDFNSVGMMAAVPFVLVVNPDVPAKNVQELIALAKKEPGKLSFASTGNGSSPQLTAEMLKNQAGIDLLHVPYRGSGPAMTDLIGGRVDMMFANALSVLPQVKEGRLRALAITSPERNESTPDIPTMSESGLDDFATETWFALFAPKGTNPEFINKLNAALVKTLESEDVKTALKNQGAVARPMSPSEADTYVKNEVSRFKNIIESANITIE